MKNILLLIAGSLLVLPACAEHIETVHASPLIVDLENVVETGVVQPVDGITSAGQPDRAALEVFSHNGYVAVVDLRTEGEARGLDEQTVVEELGMDYVSLPIGRDGISFDNANALDKLISRYDAPVLVHCRSGNRVGALLALRASLAGADDESAIEAGRAGGLTRLESQVRDVLSEN